MLTLITNMTNNETTVMLEIRSPYGSLYTHKFVRSINIVEIDIQI